jgi:hypothetical protein
MANKLTIPQRKWLRTAHLFFTCTWLGSSVAWLALAITTALSQDESLVRVAYRLMLVIDLGVIVASSTFVTITGVLLCMLTQWGLFKHRWLIVKEIGTIGVITMGATFIKVANLANISITSGSGFLHAPAFLANQRNVMTGMIIGVTVQVALLMISVFKPWIKKATPVRQ